MKIVTWNVNGFRACLKNGFADFFSNVGADVFCIQETKMQPGQADFAPEGYFDYYSSAERKGYSGTAVFTRIKPINVVYGIDGRYNDEGRVIACEYDGFFVVNAYTPNSQDGLRRIYYRMQFEDDIRAYLCRLDKQKPVIYCGDLNVAHNEIDLKNAKQNVGNAGFSYEERDKMTALLDAGFVDVYRYLNPDKREYSWWSYRFNARKNNAGWRIDYVIVSERLKERIESCKIYTDVFGSDHCPVGAVIEV